MQSEDKILYLLHQQLLSAIEETEDALQRRRVKPTAEYLSGRRYYLEMEPVRKVAMTIDALLDTTP